MFRIIWSVEYSGCTFFNNTDNKINNFLSENNSGFQLNNSTDSGNNSTTINDNLENQVNSGSYENIKYQDNVIVVTDEMSKYIELSGESIIITNSNIFSGIQKGSVLYATPSNKFSEGFALKVE